MKAKLEQLVRKIRFVTPVAVEVYDDGEEDTAEFEATFTLPSTSTREQMDRVLDGGLSIAEGRNIVDDHLVDWTIVDEDDKPLPCEGEARKQVLDSWPVCKALLISLMLGSDRNGKPARKNSETPPVH